jgi:hypothetical protein
MLGVFSIRLRIAYLDAFPETFAGTTALGNVPESRVFSVFIKNRNVMCHFNSARDVNSKNLVGFPEIPEFGKKGKPSEKKKTAHFGENSRDFVGNSGKVCCIFGVSQNTLAARYTWLKLELKLV